MNKLDYIAESERARQRAAKQAYILKGPAPDTWSSRTPAYCFTELCPVEGLRNVPEPDALPEPDEHPQGIRPMKAEKLCLCCRKRWPLDCGRERCDCEEQGYLYVVGTYRHPVIGGEANESDKGRRDCKEGSPGSCEGIRESNPEE